MILQHVLLALSAGLVSAATCAQGLPSGWRFLVLADPPIDAERVTLGMVKAQADFNGDGKTDHARILIRKVAPNSAGVFVFLTSVGQQIQAEKLDEYRFSDGEFMLSTVPNGCYRAPQRTLCLSSPGLLRSEIEYGWSTLYYTENGKWRRIDFARGEFNGL